MSTGTAARTSYDRAVAGYDHDHERELLAAITRAVVEASTLTDCNAVAIRTGELIGALLTALASALAMSPAVTRSPTATRRMIEEIHKRLRRRLADAECDPGVADFLKRAFHGTDVEGNA
jgi:Na+/H+-translocating membrane pyrophosphatase